MLHSLMAEFLGTALMILFGVGVHCDEVLAKQNTMEADNTFAITTWAFGIRSLHQSTLIVAAEADSVDFEGHFRRFFWRKKVRAYQVVSL